MTNSVALVARLTRNGQPLLPSPSYSPPSNPFSQLYPVQCNASLQLVVAVLSERDARDAGGELTPTAAAARAAASLDHPLALSQAQSRLADWWGEYHNKSRISLPDHPHLQR